MSRRGEVTETRKVFESYLHRPERSCVANANLVISPEDRDRHGSDGLHIPSKSRPFLLSLLAMSQIECHGKKRAHENFQFFSKDMLSSGECFVYAEV